MHCHLGKYTYEKEKMDILHVVDTWRPYLVGRHFKIKIDHHSLKYFFGAILIILGTTQMGHQNVGI